MKGLPQKGSVWRVIVKAPLVQKQLGQVSLKKIMYGNMLGACFSTAAVMAEDIGVFLPRDYHHTCSWHCMAFKGSAESLDSALVNTAVVLGPQNNLFCPQCFKFAVLAVR